MLLPLLTPAVFSCQLLWTFGSEWHIYHKEAPKYYLLRRLPDFCR